MSVTQHDPPPLRPWLAPASIMLLAVAVRIVTMAYPTLDSDMAIMGLMARHILAGEFPIFFLGEPFGGSIESLLAAPLMALLGSSAEALSLAPFLFSLVFVWVAFLAGRDMWGRRAGLMAMLFAALPPYFFAWHSVLPRGAYIEIPLFSLLLAWLAFRLVHRGASLRLWFLYGLVAGVGLWTHFLIVFALAATGLYLLLITWRGLLRGLAPALAGFLLGSLPLWIYNLAHDWPSFTYLLSTQPRFGFWEVVQTFFAQGLPILLGVFRDGATDPVIPLASYLIWSLGLTALGYILWLRRQGLWDLLRLTPGRADGAEIFLLLALMVVVIAALKGESIHSTRRHLTPLYAALIPLAGYAAAKLYEQRRGLALALISLALASNLWGVAATSPLVNPQARQEAQTERECQGKMVAALLERGVFTAYALDFWVAHLLTFASQERLVAVQPQIAIERFHGPSQRRVGQSPAVAYLCWREASGVLGMLKAMDARFQTVEASPYTCFHDIQGPGGGMAQIPPVGWQATASHQGQDAALAFDQDALTRWSPLTVQQPGQSFTLDMGEVVPGVCMVRLASGREDDQPRGLSLELSPDGQTWRRAAKMGEIATPLHWDGGRPLPDPGHPRLDLRFPPQPARFLRLTQHGASRDSYWSLQEISVYRAAPEAKPANGRAVVQAAQDLGARRLYSGRYLEAFTPARLLPPALDPPDNLSWPMELDPRGLLPLDLKGVVLALEAADAPLAADFLRCRGIAFKEHRAGGYALFHDLRPPPCSPEPLPLMGLKAQSSQSGQEALALDKDPATRWTTGRPHLAGDFFQVDLGQEVELGGLALHSQESPLDLARQVTLAVSLDGEQWQHTPWRDEPDGPIIFTGDRLLGAQPGRLRLRIPDARARFVRLSLTADHPSYFWSIHELEVLPPAGSAMHCCPGAG